MEVDDSKISVGHALSQPHVYSVSHPMYQQFSAAVHERARDIAVERGSSRATNRSVLLGVALQPEETNELTEAYPEFTVVTAGRARPAHAFWVAYRRLANEWLMEQADKYSSKIAHLGGNLGSYLLSGAGSDAVLLYDLSEPVAVHEKYSTVMEAHGMYENYVATSRALGRMVDHRVYDRYLRGDGVRFHSKVSMIPSADVLLVDLSIAAYSPMQVASMMMQSSSQVAFGFFVYHPSMLFEEEGEIANTGVYFRREGDHMVFRYPEGVAGVVDGGAHTWSSWLVGHTFSLGVGAGQRWFQVELLQNRGHLMFFRMTALTIPPAKQVIHHAMEVGKDDSYVVSAWRLKRFGANPSVRSSWDLAAHVVPRRVVDRLYQFAMQLPKEQFTRYALRKQVSAINDRVTVEGTRVVVVKALPVQVVDALVVAVYSRAFVDRYDTTQLTAEAMLTVKRVAAFATAGMMVKTGYIMWVCAQTAYDYTFGALNSVVRESADAVRDVMSRGLPSMEASFADIPPYLLVSHYAKGAALPRDIGALVAVENARRASLTATGFGTRWAKAFASMTTVCDVHVYRKYKVEQASLSTTSKAVGDSIDLAMSAIRTEIAVDEPGLARDQVEATVVVRAVADAARVDYDPVADPVEVFNRLHSAVFPGVAEQNLEHDTASVSLDAQDRFLAASRMVLPLQFGDVPVSRAYYKSKVSALGVPKRQQTVQELLSAMAARNMNAPQVSLPQDEDAIVPEIWNKFLDCACVPDARDKLRVYQSDPVSISDDAFREWATQSGQDKLDNVRRELADAMLYFSEMSVADYMVMLKSDVKPSLSVKPLDQRTEPQVIVYHRKALSALFSALFRVLVRRFLSLLKPEYHVNLLKDTRDIEGFLCSVHPYGRKKDLTYLENDFSKYDKSQGRLAFLLEWYMFEQLGMNEEMLHKWLSGHVKCKMRAVGMAMSLEVWYQRKSGDATTAFGNVALNIMAVSYAYAGTKVLWALFMGDDSLVCCDGIVAGDRAVDVLAEVFNLGAKMFITTSPYFASNFVFVSDDMEKVVLVPDPVKRAERWSMSISADDPQWDERYISACDAMSVYLNAANTAALPRALLERYGVSTDLTSGVASAVATVLSSQESFRSMWELEPEISLY